MKKIVALVLSLVMALSLCTVAFASFGLTMYKVVDGDIKTTEEWPKTGETLKTVAAVNNVSGSGTIAYYSYSANGQTVPMVPCTKDKATFAIYNNGAFVDWVYMADSTAKADYQFKVTAQSATTAKPNCTTAQYVVDGYLDANGNFYVDAKAGEMNATQVYYDGIIILVKPAIKGTEILYASHIFAKGVKNTTTGYDVATCLICKGEFAATNDEKVATKNGYKISTGFAYDTAEASAVYNANAFDNGYDFAWGQTYANNYKFCWQLKPGTTQEIGTTKPDTTKDGVNSAKTFDAGIAMYVGMSLLSVAGSAVVIGKKKEF